MPYFAVAYLVLVFSRFTYGEFRFYLSFQEPLIILAICMLGQRFKKHIMLGILLLFLTSIVIGLTQLVTTLKQEESKSTDFEMIQLMAGVYLLFICPLAIPSFKWLLTFQILALLTCIASGMILS